jgi:APA family basic amino acid/polyamine antiporter
MVPAEYGAICLTLTAFFLVLNYSICCLALVVLRRREPSRPRPFRAWGYPWSAAVVLIGAVALAGGTLVGDPVNGIGGLTLLAAGLAGRAVVAKRDGDSVWGGLSSW